MKYLVIALTMLIAFLSLLGIIIAAKALGFSPENFHEPLKIFDPLTVIVTLAILAIPIFIIIFSQRFLLRAPLKTIGLGLPNKKLFLVGVVVGLIVKLIATVGAYFYSTSPVVDLALTGITLGEWVPYFLWFLVTLFLNSFNEELAYRSFPLGNTLTEGFFKHFLVWTIAAFFSVMHFIVEPPEVGSFFYRLTFGLFAGLLYLRLRSLWLVVGLHTGWNFVALTLADSDWRTGSLFRISGLTEGSMTWSNILFLSLAYFVILSYGKSKSTEQ
jgi:membrane protease YdiL (CAAX protease family)